MEFRDIIKTRREQLGITLADVAKHVGVSEATVSRWESGEIVNIRRDKIAKLSEVLKVTPAYLMGWEEDNQPASVSGDELTAEFVELFSRLTPEQRKLIISQIKGILASQ